MFWFVLVTVIFLIWQGSSRHNYGRCISQRLSREDSHAFLFPMAIISIISMKIVFQCSWKMKFEIKEKLANEIIQDLGQNQENLGIHYFLLTKNF